MQEKIQRIEALLKEAYDIFDTLPQGNGSGFFAGLTVVDESGERKSASHNFVFHTGNTKEGATKFAEVILKNIHKEKARPLAAILSLPYLLPEGSKLRGVWDVFPEMLAADKAPVLDPDSLENSLRIVIDAIPDFMIEKLNRLTGLLDEDEKEPDSPRSPKGGEREERNSTPSNKDRAPEISDRFRKAIDDFHQAKHKEEEDENIQACLFSIFGKRYLGETNVSAAYIDCGDPDFIAEGITKYLSLPDGAPILERLIVHLKRKSLL